MKTVIYYNPRCSKCREALCLLEEKGEKVEIIEYLKDTPTQKELIEVIKKLKIKPEDLVRKSEELYKDKYADKKLTGRQWIKIMADNPILIERPIVIKGGKAIIGRPPQLVVDIL
jgi:arsenate reductase